MSESSTSTSGALPLGGQVALVTGASSGIGQAITWALAAGGATVCAIGRNRPALAKTAQGGPRPEPAVVPLPMDLHSLESSERARRFVAAEFGRLDILVHSAAVMHLARLRDASAHDFDLQYEVNLRAPYALTQALLGLLKTSRGQIVFVNSSSGLTAARPEVAQYAACKHGLKAIADAIRHDVNGDGIRVLTVYPGRTATPLQAALHNAEGKPYRPELLLQPSDVAAIVLSALVLQIGRAHV